MTRHTPVLLRESVEGLDLKEGEILLDGTFGGGGHSKEVRKRFGEKVRIIALDRNPRVAEDHPESHVHTENFRHLDKVLDRLGISHVDAVLLDLGLSSDQLETSGKGFSFQKDEPLDMRMEAEGPTAEFVLNRWSEETLELILRGFGEERYSRKIAKAIVERREEKPFLTTRDLVETIERAVPASYLRGKIHPATRTFQALRIAVNEELGSLEEGLLKGFQVLKEGGRLAVISFHSLEDRMVKNFFRDKSKTGEAELLHKKPLTPSEEEIKGNPRSRSAKLRILKKL